MYRVCRGQNSQGELLLGTQEDVAVPVRNAVCDAHGGPVEVVCGNEFTGVLCADGVVLTAGLNKTGQCARETSADPKVWAKRHLSLGPVVVPGNRPVAKIVRAPSLLMCSPFTSPCPLCAFAVL